MTFQESWQKILKRPGKRSLTQVQEAAEQTETAADCFAVIKQSLAWVNVARDVPGFENQKDGWRRILHMAFSRLKDTHCPPISSHQEADHAARMRQLQNLAEHLRHMKELQMRWRRIFREEAVPCTFAHWISEKEGELPEMKRQIAAMRNGSRAKIVQPAAVS